MKRLMACVVLVMAVMVISLGRLGNNRESNFGSATVVHSPVNQVKPLDVQIIEIQEAIDAQSKELRELKIRVQADFIRQGYGNRTLYAYIKQLKQENRNIKQYLELKGKDECKGDGDCK